MKIAIIGSGISAIIVAKTFLEYNYKVYLFDSENILDKKDVNHEKTSKFIPDVNKSPKYNNKNLTKSLKKFKKKYNIYTKNFFLVSGLVSGGLSNFWGAGLEIPGKKYLKKYLFAKAILNQQNIISKELRLNKEKFRFYDFFFKQPLIKRFLKKKDNSIYFSKFLPAVEQYNKKKLNIDNYNNIDLLSSYNKHIYNSKAQIFDLLKNKNFIYTPNTFVTNIRKSRTYELITDNKKKLNLKFSKIIISAGTVGSTILVDRILKCSEKYRLFHTPMLKIMYFSIFLPFRLKNKIKFSLPLLNLNIHIKKEKFFGSLMHLNNISNSFFGISKFNILFSLLKKFIFVGNIFLPSNNSHTFIKIVNNKTLIYSDNDLDQKELIFTLRKKLNSFLSKFNLFEFFSQNLKFLENGSDAHYTSTLENKYINGKKLLLDNCELYKFKNIHIIDGSSIKPGLFYPTYFLMLHARHISKKIINNDKKNKNKY